MKKNNRLAWSVFIVLLVGYLFFFSGFIGVLLGFGCRVFQVAHYHFTENTTVFIYYLFRDVFFFCFLWDLWKRKGGT